MPSARSGSNNPDEGEKPAMRDLSLLKYFDALQQPAMIFSASPSMSLEVAYVNSVFFDSIGDSPLAEEHEFVGTERMEGVPANFMAILQTHCISPSAADFVQWVHGITNDPKSHHLLKTRFKGFMIPKDGDTSERIPQVADIEWSAMVMESKYIVLNGRRLGTVQFSPTSQTPDAGSEVPDRGHDKADEVQVPKASSYVASSSSSSSSGGSHSSARYRAGTSRLSSSTTVSDRPRIGAFKEEDEEGQNEAYRWRHTEKFVKAMGGEGEMGKMVRQKDWSKTELGPLDSWSETLTAMTSLVMTSSSPMALWWGKSHRVIYNDGYIHVAGKKHPDKFGASGREFWEELFPVIGPIIDDVMAGESIYSEDQLLLMERSGYLEETFFTWSYIPIRNELGEVDGFLNPCFETTTRILAERRLRTIRELDEQTSLARTSSELGRSISRALKFNGYDIPFALIYFCSAEFNNFASCATLNTPSGDRKTSLHSGNQAGSASLTNKSDPTVWVYKLQDTIGIPLGHDLAPDTVELHLMEESTEELHVWPFRAMAENQNLIEMKDLPSEVLEGIQHSGWPELPKDAIALPIVGARDLRGREALMGMVILGINPRRAFDEGYRTFTSMCARQIAASMTLVKNIEEESAKADEMAALNRDRTSFFNSVSHELRTPLTLILGPLDECIEDTSLSQQHKGRLEIVRRNARRLLRLVNSLLDFSRLEAGRMRATFRETNIQRYTADLASLFRSAIEKGGVQYRVDTNGRQRHVWIDRDMWEKIVFNIIGNAFKFTLSGEIVVTCRLSDDSRYMQFSVQDSGTGIPSHEIARIFERFHRVHDQQGRSYEGTGIGLALTQELVKLHDGKLEVESTYGQGTKFTVSIRVGNSHIPEDMIYRGPENEELLAASRVYGQGVVEEAGRWATSTDRHTGGASTGAELARAMSSSSSDTVSTVAMQANQWLPITSRGCRVLIADDNEDMRRYVKGVLLQFYQVIEAANGQEALSLAVQEKPDLILSDVEMGALSGYGLLKVLRASSDTRTIPFILLSAQATEEARVQGLLAGADDYLAKPFNAKELIARVHTHLDIARMRVQLEKRVTERTKDLMESQERARFLTPSGESNCRILSAISPVGIFRIDLLGTLTYANPKWREITGLEESLDDSTGERLIRGVHPDDRAAISKQWREAIENRERCSFEVRWGTPDSFRWAMGEIVPEVFYEEVHGFIGVLTDVTERRQLEAEKLDAAEEIRAQQELAIDVICHELRNPLNGIYHNADIVNESMRAVQTEVLKFRDELLRLHATTDLSSIAYTPRDSEAVAHLFDFIVTELSQNLESLESLNLCAKHQKRIADDVLQMSKLSMNLVSLSISPFDPLVETSNVIRMFEREAFVKKIAFKFNMGPRFAVLGVSWVNADPIRFSQVLLNFISNAVRFTEKSPHREIEIRLDASNDEPEFPSSLTASQFANPHISGHANIDESKDRIFLIVTVADTGVGLTAEERSNLFQKFAQASPRTHIEYGGSGLGLFISKSLVEVQGGRIALESEKGKGTTLTFYIRAEKVASPEGALVSSANNAPRLAINSRSSSPLRIKTPRLGYNRTSSPGQNRLSVLVVEDNLVLTRQLQLAGFETAVANHGLECLEILDSSTFDVVLMDLFMPQMSGLEATAEIRRREASGLYPSRTPVIAVTGNARTEYVDKAAEAGVDGFIVKPYEKENLMEKIRSLVG